MAAFEVIALDPATPQLRAPGPADTYTFPRAVAMSVALPVSSGGTGTSTPSLVAGTNVTITGSWPNQTISASGGGGSSTLTISNKTGAYTVVAGDLGTIINCTSGTFTVSLTAAASLGSGFNCWIWNTGTGTITVDPSGAETIDGVATLTLSQGEGMQIVCNGTNWDTGDKKTMRAFAQSIATATTRAVASGQDATAIGGSSSATGQNSLALGSYSSAGGIGGVAIGYASASSTDSIAIGGSAGFQRPQANSSRALSIGANSSLQGSIANGTSAVAINGSYASGVDSFAAAVVSNSSTYGATGANSIAIGVLNQSQSNSSVAIGDFSTASATNSTAIGSQCSATASQTIALGNSARSQTVGKYSYASGNFGSSTDICQEGKYVLRRATTNATATVLTTDNTAPGSNDQVILPDNSAYAFVGTVAARQQASGGTQSAAWKIEGLIRREANAASTTIVASTVTVISNVPGWTLALSADTTNGGLAITATGAVGTNIRWVATVATSEVNYA